MTETKNNERKMPDLSGALAVFIVELETHILFFESVVSKYLDSTPEIFFEGIKKEARQFEYRFHAIKGGAGFLALKEAEKVASAAEQIFKGQQINIKDPKMFRQVLTEHLISLKNELKKLS